MKRNHVTRNERHIGWVKHDTRQTEPIRPTTDRRRPDCIPLCCLGYLLLLFLSQPIAASDAYALTSPLPASDVIKCTSIYEPPRRHAIHFTRRLAVGVWWRSEGKGRMRREIENRLTWYRVVQRLHRVLIAAQAAAAAAAAETTTAASTNAYTYVYSVKLDYILISFGRAAAVARRCIRHAQ